MTYAVIFVEKNGDRYVIPGIQSFVAAEIVAQTVLTAQGKRYVKHGNGTQFGETVDQWGGDALASIVNEDDLVK